MISDSLGQTLHDRATRGHALTLTEQQQLETWYAQQDAAEANGLTIPPATHESDRLQERIHQALETLTLLSQEMQAIAQENATIRQTNKALLS